MSQAGDANLTHAADHLRQHDFDLYAALHYAPADKRPALIAIGAYLAEIARIRGLVSDPMPGEIRLQWWRDTLSGAAEHGAPQANPLAAAVLQTLDRHRVPTAPLLAVLDARQFDLYDDAMPSMGDLEGYAGEVWSGPSSLMAAILSGDSPARFADGAGHGGVALAIARILEELPAWAARGQCYLPADLMAAHNVSRDSLKDGRATPDLAALLAAFARHGDTHLQKAADALGALPDNSYPAFLILALAGKSLARVPGWSSQPFASPLIAPRWKRLWWLSRAAKRLPDL